MSVKLGNALGTPVKIKSIDVKCEEWTCAPPIITSVFGLHDSLELTFEPISNVVETALVTLITDSGPIVHEVIVAPLAVAEVNSAIQPGLFVSPVWPNPAKDNLSFNLHGLGNKEINAYIYDLQGKELLNRRIDRDGSISLTLPSLAEGRYYFMLRDGMETITLQEIKIAK